MKFVNRNEELKRLQQASVSGSGWFGVVWGRRRIGKTRLLTEWIKHTKGVYIVADRSASAIQRVYCAQALAESFPGIDDVVYPDWRSLLARLSVDARRSGWRGPLVIDEFPYLVESDPALPSVFQNWIDHGAQDLQVVISGSSRRMMQGLVLDHDAPLYGRAHELMKLAPLPPGLLEEALHISEPRNLVEAWAVWGGVPRYWELAQPFAARLDAAVDGLVLDPLGPLHEEPDRLLLEELPSAISLRPILDIIGTGAHRLSEIAARLGKPATSLARPLQHLVEMDLVRKEQPFGESPKKGKRSLYKINDPFFNLWFRVVAPNKSLYVEATPATRTVKWKSLQTGLFSEAWEELCRKAVPCLDTQHSGGAWLPARRYWRGNDPEFDIVAQSVDGTHVLLGEVKWSDKPLSRTALAKAVKQLLMKGLPSVVANKNPIVHHAVFVPMVTPGVSSDDALIYTAREVMSVLV